MLDAYSVVHDFFEKTTIYQQNYHNVGYMPQANTSCFAHLEHSKYAENFFDNFIVLLLFNQFHLIINYMFGDKDHSA